MPQPYLPAPIKPKPEAVKDFRERLELSLQEAQKLAQYHAFKEAIEEARTIDDLRRILWTLVEHV